MQRASRILDNVIKKLVQIEIENAKNKRRWAIAKTNNITSIIDIFYIIIIIIIFIIIFIVTYYVFPVSLMLLL